MLSRVGHGDAFLGSNTRDHAFGDEVNGTLFMPGEVVHHHLLLTNHPLQKAWQGDPIVERIGLVGEHMDAAIRIKLAQGLRGGRSGHSIADNHIAFVVLCQISTSSLLAEPWITPPSPGVLPLLVLGQATCFVSLPVVTSQRTNASPRSSAQVCQLLFSL